MLLLNGSGRTSILLLHNIDCFHAQTHAGGLFLLPSGGTLMTHRLRRRASAHTVFPPDSLLFASKLKLCVGELFSAAKEAASCTVTSLTLEPRSASSGALAAFQAKFREARNQCGRHQACRLTTDTRLTAPVWKIQYFVTANNNTYHCCPPSLPHPRGVTRLCALRWRRASVLPTAFIHV